MNSRLEGLEERDGSQETDGFGGLDEFGEFGEFGGRGREALAPPRTTWAVILAGGEGSRLQGMTVDDEGRHVPKQFCRIDGRHTLLELALRRAGRLAARSHVVASVTEAHEFWWRPQLGSLPAANIVSQPVNRGTAFGILLPLLFILKRDPHANIVFVPADHYVADERELAKAVRRALALASARPEVLALIGVEPERAEGDYGYILPGGAIAPRSRRVRRFVEKPGDGASDLIGRGALWNTFIFAARGSTLLHMFQRRMEGWSSVLWGRVHEAGDDPREFTERLDDLYHTLPSKDFSRDVLARESAGLAVVPASRCGWSDLGNPRRVVAWMRERDAAAMDAAPVRSVAAGGHLRLAARDCNDLDSHDTHFQVPADGGLRLVPPGARFNESNSLGGTSRHG